MVNTWSKEEIEILRNNYLKCSRDAIQKLLPKRSWRTIMHYALDKLKLRKRQRPLRWSGEEDKKLRQHYPNASKNDLLTLFSSRNMQAIRDRACKLKISKAPLWTEHEEEVAKQMIKVGYTLVDVSKGLNKPLSSVRSRNLTRWKIATRPSAIINLAPTAHFTYLLGALLGDGTVGQKKRHWRVVLNVTDKEFAEAFAKALHSIGIRAPIVHEYMRPSLHSNANTKFYNCGIGCKKFAQWYDQLSIEKLSCLLDNREKILAFLRGFYDSEGNLYQNSRGSVYIKMTNTKKELLDYIFYLIEALGYNSKVSPGKQLKSGKKIFDIHILGSSEQKLDFLRELAPNIPRRSVNKVDLSKIPKERRWTMHESEILKQHYPTATKSTLLSLLPKRTWCAVRSYAQHVLKLQRKIGPARWNEQEKQILKRYYTTSSKNKILELLPGRSWSAARTYAQRKLKFHRLQKTPPWKKEEDKVLINTYSAQLKYEILKLLRNRTWSAITTRAWRLKICRHNR